MKRKGKLIVIAGTDGSGKETQTKKLIERLREEGIPVESMSFPRYDTPTGRIIAGPYLGKPHVSESWFAQGPDAVDPKIACLYFAADRRAAIPEMEEILNSGTHLILDRYEPDNKAHQGGKIPDAQAREEFYQWMEHLEYDHLALPRPDETVFLYVPTDTAMALRAQREKEQGKTQAADGHEGNEQHLRNAEQAYLQLAELYNWKRINCVTGDEPSMRTREDIHEEVYETARTILTS